MDPAADLLSQLDDIQLPAATGWNIAPGWILLLLLLVIGALIVVGWYRQRLPQQNLDTDWRQEARIELTAIENRVAEGQVDDVFPACSRLARRIALATCSREDVASLTGDRWLQHLDTMLGERRFTEGEGRLLADGPYRRQQEPNLRDLQVLTTLLRRLLDSTVQEQTPA